MRKVTIIMSTYNGEKYIEDQIDSIFKQSDVDIKLIIRDDGSTDLTREIISKKIIEYKSIEMYFDGNNIGACNSFLWLLEKSNDIDSDYYAFCDQDDIWAPNKLNAAIKMIEKEEQINDSLPILYCSAVTFVDEDLNVIANSFINTDQITFERSIFDNRAIGCTLVFNKRLIQKYLKYFNGYEKYIVMHDWTLVLLAHLIGKVVYDNNSYIFYRQHSNNVVGGTNIKKSFVNKLYHFYTRDIQKQNNSRTKQLKFFQQRFKDNLSNEQYSFIDLFFENYRRNILSRLFYILFNPIPAYSNNMKLKLCALFLMKKI